MKEARETEFYYTSFSQADLQTMKNFSVFISKHFFLVLTSLGGVEKGVCSRICLFFAIINAEVLSREFLDSTNFSKVETLSIYKLLEVIVSSKDKNLIFATLQVVVRSLNSLNNG